MDHRLLADDFIPKLGAPFTIEGLGRHGDLVTIANCTNAASVSDGKASRKGAAGNML